MEPKLGRNDKRGITIARGTAWERHLSVPEDWVQKWEARERELHALFAGGALSPEFVEGIVERTLQQEMAAYLAAYRTELPAWRRTLGI
jgi:hypothetical protein